MSYRIADEPRPTRLGQLAVRPFWPLFAVMLAGTWLSWPWFVVNAFAVGSPNRRRETLVAVLGVIGTAALIVGIIFVGRGLSEGQQTYLPLLLVGWKLGISYWLFFLQAETFELYEYFGGTVKNGMLGVALGFMLQSRVIEAASSLHPLLPALVR